MAREYRSRTRILYDLLKAVKDEPGVGTTRLLLLANLSHDRLQGYLAELAQRGLVGVEEASDRRGYRITDRGQHLLGELDRIHRFMADFGLGL